MNIIVYTKTGCPWCIGVTTMLAENNISFEERNVTDNQDYMDEMIKISDQSKAPTLIIDGEVIADSDKDEVRKKLENKGIVLK